MHLGVRAAYRRLLRARAVAFAGDAEMLIKGREHIRNEFLANKSASSEGQVCEHALVEIVVDCCWMTGSVDCAACDECAGCGKFPSRERGPSCTTTRRQIWLVLPHESTRSLSAVISGGEGIVGAGVTVQKRHTREDLPDAVIR